MAHRRKTRGRGRLVLLLLWAILALTGCAGAGGTGAGAAGDEGEGMQPSLLPGGPGELPAFDLARFRELLGELEGTPVAVYFWASWCGPCYREAPEVAEAFAKLGDRVQFLGVDVQDQPGPAREFIAEFGWEFPSVSDPERAILRGLGFFAPPVTLIYDASGEEAFVWSGPITADLLTEKIEEVLGAS